MRLLLTVVLIVATLGWIGCVLPGSFCTAEDATGLPASGQPMWRRTAVGWERADQWPCFRRQQKSPPAPPPVHPLPIAGLMLAGSLAALVIFEPTTRKDRAQNPPR